MRAEVGSMKAVVEEALERAKDAEQNVPEPKIEVRTEEVEILPEEMDISEIISLKREDDKVLINGVVVMDDESYPTQLSMPFAPFRNLFKKKPGKKPIGKKGKGKH
jgi:hypothetical protein